MAVYKVPQDVEADDKLIGPFSFRQFVYLIIVIGSGFIGYFLSQLFFPLFIIVLPVILLFGALALPLRKDQPMETYLAAIVSFYIKPRKRMWIPDGTQSFVEITVPNVVEVHRVKDISESEAEQRLSYLANIVDSRGWAVRGVQSQTPTSPGAMTNDAYFEAQSAPDVLDESMGIGQVFDTKLDQADAQRHQQMLDNIRAQSVALSPVATPQIPASPPVAVMTDPYAVIPTPQSVSQPQQPSQPPQAQPQALVDDSGLNVAFNPYPTMHQSVLAPIDQNAPRTPVATPAPPAPTVIEPEPKKPIEKPVSPDIINLANNPDLSVETIAREANRIREKEKLSEDEVVISLR